MKDDAYIKICTTQVAFVPFWKVELKIPHHLLVPILIYQNEHMEHASLSEKQMLDN